MPPLARAFIKLGMVHFVLGSLMGVLVLAQSALALPSSLALLYPTYLHILTVGWITQLIFGVAYWMFPKYSKENPRRNERLGWAVLLLLNGGLVLRVIGEPLHGLAPQSAAGWLLALSAVCQLLAGWGFVWNTWPRVKER